LLIRLKAAYEAAFFFYGLGLKTIFQLIWNVFRLELAAVALHLDFKHQLNFEKRIEQLLI
jgi:hypothetical protein